MLQFMGLQRVGHHLAIDQQLGEKSSLISSLNFKVRMSRGFQFSSVAQSCPTLCDPMNRSMTGLPAHHQLSEFTQTHVHRVGDAIQPSHPLSARGFSHYRIKTLHGSGDQYLFNDIIFNKFLILAFCLFP